MTTERTFSIIKPDATARNLTGAINAMIEQAGLRIIAQKRVRITRERSGNVLCRAPRAAILPRAGRLHDLGAGGGAGARRRECDREISRHHGRDRPGEGGADGTIRKVHAKSIGENSVHGSDAAETAAKEIAQFFSGNELVG